MLGSGDDYDVGVETKLPRASSFTRFNSASSDSVSPIGLNGPVVTNQNVELGPIDSCTAVILQLFLASASKSESSNNLKDKKLSKYEWVDVR